MTIPHTEDTKEMTAETRHMLIVSVRNWDDGTISFLDFEKNVEELLTTYASQVREEALAREKQLKEIHTMELDAISCKSIEDFVIWRDYRKQRPKQAELTTLTQKT